MANQSPGGSTDRKADYAARIKKAWDTRGRKRISALYAKLVSKVGGGSAPEAKAKADAKPGGEKPPPAVRKLKGAAEAWAESRIRRAYSSEPTTKTPPPPYTPDVEKDADGDGVTDAARVGVPADMVPPPPKVPRLPNLTATEREHEAAFADAYEKDPDGFAKKYIEMVQKSDKPNTFEADAAKNLYAAWAGKDGGTPEERAEFRATMNTALHQTANAIAKRAFLMHLDSLSDEDKAKGLMVTVGGCASGKGYATKSLKDKIPELDTKRYGVVWDSAGDQNATENPWLLKEAKKRGIKVTYAYVSADPETSWADPDRGAMKRAEDPKDGRMVDAHVYADSYVLGAKNHNAFHKKHEKDAAFLFIENGKVAKLLDRVPDSDLKRDRNKLRRFAQSTAVRGKTIPKRIKRGALAGSRIWSATKGA